MTDTDRQLVALCREWAASPIGLTILSTLADRIEALAGDADRMGEALERIEDIAGNATDTKALSLVASMARAGKGKYMTKKTDKTPIWCDYCNAEISPAGVRGCVRSTCATKARLADREAGK